MKPDGTNFKYMRVCEQCGNTFERDEDSRWCKPCEDSIINHVRNLTENNKFDEADKFLRAL